MLDVDLFMRAALCGLWTKRPSCVYLSLSYVQPRLCLTQARLGVSTPFRSGLYGMAAA